MNFSQMKDERLLLFYDAVRQQVILDGNGRYRFAGQGVSARMRISCAKKWNGDGFYAHRLAKLMIDFKIEVPNQVRELAFIGTDNADKALALFFNSIAKSLRAEFS